MRSSMVFGRWGPILFSILALHEHHLLRPRSGSLVVSAFTKNSFTCSPRFSFSSRQYESLSTLTAAANDATNNANDDNDEKEPPSMADSQKALWEEWSRLGAPKIAQLDIPERAKRALLAETVEDQILSYTAQIEDLLKDNEDASKDHRETILELAQRTKTLQGQYNELVSGEPSTILETLTKAFDNDGDSEDAT